MGLKCAGLLARCAMRDRGLDLRTGTDFVVLILCLVLTVCLGGIGVMNEIEVNKATGDFRFLEIGEPMESKAALSILLFGYRIYS